VAAVVVVVVVVVVVAVSDRARVKWRGVKCIKRIKKESTLEARLSSKVFDHSGGPTNARRRDI
jgi:type II secretory pathway component PulK